MIDIPERAPALFLFNVDILGMYRVYGAKLWMLDGHRDVDVLVNYNYQEIFYDVVWKYVDPRFLQKCREEIDVTLPEKELVNQMMDSVYRDYFMFFLYQSKLENVPFEEWIQEDHSFIFARTKLPNFVYEIKRYYQMIVCLRAPYYRPMFNEFNMYYNQPPNCIDPEELVDKAVNSLLPEGKFVLLDCTHNDDVYMHEDLEYESYPHIFKKKKNIKKIELVDKIGYL